MAKEKLGERTECRHCGKPIYYCGTNWLHVHSGQWNCDQQPGPKAIPKVYLPGHGPADMFGNDLTKTDSFGTPVGQKVWVGRVDGDRNAKVPFKTIGEAEHFIAQLEIFFPEEVHAGNFYIDAPEGDRA